MNARQKCKKLKQRNKLLIDVLTANPDFIKVFDYRNKSFKAVTPQMHLQTYAATYPIDFMYGDDARDC